MVSKFNNDVYYANSHVASVGGVQTSELNLLEKYFLEIVNWNVRVDENECLRYFNHLVAVE
eukprot:CAMPEP_0176383902 /NCGR_PEP_ID=MMETSP0126-20121128/33887_1 /TAXON_ID=141414 ORGANISM="Strombidinopsis acuminatum, Strain SPMC142" /NCGR_SAMPLE_ID=MMETSP0126 /ASSEMBLY_ACC=CAM_ASM_000229 /LENGTH=60 /DNA_ID=CAMNT_0017749273 /DNA_START=367 /DNA_END=549 /DNA_ORIENTATION=+